ncbi:MAG: hypothetical protein LBT00_02835, partial [Spirochaetaceae bacterium]|nr:hypothetical protein [Spirochaetaceae bacterium]
AKRAAMTGGAKTAVIARAQPEAIQTRSRANASRCLLDCFALLAMIPAVGEAGRNDGGCKEANMT